MDEKSTPSIEKKNDPDFSIISFLEEQPESGMYRIDLFDVTDTRFGMFYFTPSNARSFSVTLPYFGIAKRYQVYDTSREEMILEGSLETFVSCNANGICEHEKNENASSCISDCGSHAVYSEETKKKFEKSDEPLKDQDALIRVDTGTIPTQESQSLPLSFITAFGVIFVVIFGGMFFLVWKIMRK